MDNYDVSEKDAASLWKKAHWYGVLHPACLIFLVFGFFLKYLIFNEETDIFLYEVISVQDMYIGLVVLTYIILCHLFRLKYIKKHLSDKFRKLRK